MAIRLKLSIALVLVSASCWGQSTEDPAQRPVLILTYGGLNHNRPGAYAQEFARAILPEAAVHAVGFHGVVPDRWRRSAGFSAIVRYETDADRQRAVDEIYALTKASRTILDFDFNESIVPNGARDVVRPWLRRMGTAGASPVIGEALARSVANKIEKPSLVGVLVAERWLRARGGILILRVHSDGTYAARYLVDQLVQRGMAPHAVFLESRLQSFGEWEAKASQLRSTEFFDITAENDVPIGVRADPPGATMTTLNWHRLEVTGKRDVLTAHSVVTQWTTRLDLTFGDSWGTQHLPGTTIGEHVKQLLAPLVVSQLHNLARNDRSAPSAPTPPDLARLKARSQDELHELKKTKILWRETAKDMEELARKWADALRNANRPGHHQLRLLANVLTLRNALHEDIERARSGSFVVLSEESIQGIAKVALDVIKWVHQTHSSGEGFGAAGWMIERAAGFEKLAKATRRISSGNFDAEAVDLTVEGTAKLVKQTLLDEAKQQLRSAHGVIKLEQELVGLRVYQQEQLELKQLAVPGKAEARVNERLEKVGKEIARRKGLLDAANKPVKEALAKLGARLHYLDVAGDLAAAIAIHAQHGKPTLESVDRLSDAMITFFATVIVFPIAASPWAPALRETLIFTARFVRRATADAPIYAVANTWWWGRHDRGQALEIYMQDRMNRIRMGEAPVALDVFYPEKERRQVGIRQADVDYWKVPLELTSSTIEPEQDAATVGGRKKAVEPPSIKVKDPEIQGRRKLDDLKPWPPDDSKKPFRRGQQPPGAIDSGNPPPRNPQAASSDDDPPEPPGEGVKGATVNVSPRYAPLDSLNSRPTGSKP